MQCSASRVLNSNNGATNLWRKELRVPMPFLRKADEPPHIHVTFNDKRGDGSEPCTALSLRSDAWKKHWTKHENDRRAHQLVTAFEQAGDEAVNFQNVNGHSRFTACQVAGALCAMKSERSCGLDHWTPGNWLNLPIEAREAIASILSECEEGLVWPHQVMQNAVPLLGKSAADDRPISLTSLLYAVYVKIKKTGHRRFLTVRMRLGGTLLLLGTPACVRVSGDGSCLGLLA